MMGGRGRTASPPLCVLMSLKRRVRAERRKPTSIYITFLCKSKNTAKIDPYIPGGGGGRGQGQALTFSLTLRAEKKLENFHIFSLLCAKKHFSL